MITAMTLLLQLLTVSVLVPVLVAVLVAIVVAVLLAALMVYLVDAVRDDGYRSLDRRTPPASHHADPFDPRSRLA